MFEPPAAVAGLETGMTIGPRAWLLALALLVLAPEVADASHRKEQPKKHKVVYHLPEAGTDKARFVLGNIQNHIEGVGGLENVEAIELVVHGPALKTFVTASIDPEVRAKLDRLQVQGVTFGACGNTMKTLNLTLEQLPPGARYLPQGGVVRVMELVEQGYVYIRP
jgi:intracellular sulfur oxidation DsrE/DsrF family protein